MPRFDDLNLLDISLKCIELFVAQVVMSDYEEHFYDDAFQGFIDAPRFHESFVSTSRFSRPSPPPYPSPSSRWMRHR
jgi:hypothetical protein